MCTHLGDYIRDNEGGGSSPMCTHLGDYMRDNEGVEVVQCAPT